MSEEIEYLLNYVKDNISLYNVSYTKNVLGFDDGYIVEFYDDIIKDCWITARTLMSTFNQGDIKVQVYFYHIEDPFFVGYHDFLIFDIGNNIGYLCDSWCGKYSLKIKTVDTKYIEEIFTNFRNFSFVKRQKVFLDLFGVSDIEINHNVTKRDIKITITKFVLYYDKHSVIHYPNGNIPNKDTIGNVVCY
jgi:hypothetical protein